ncbi:MAG: flagellar hook capping protein [Ruminococcaceae bacterium]|nr:flagellar hook capping protein [Oscillospiraceae bacterium]
MSEYSFDLTGVLGTQQSSKVAENSTNKKAGGDMVMDDFLKLMVAQFQNQSIDNTADTTEMMNQMVQMSVIQAITNLSTLVSDSTNLSYAASLVGKEVTIGQRSGSSIEEILGTVTGTGTLDGKQVIFLDNRENPYYLTDIMAVGRLPEIRAASAATGGGTSDGTSYQSAGGTGSIPMGGPSSTTTDGSHSSSATVGERDPHVPDEDGALG